MLVDKLDLHIKLDSWSVIFPGSIFNDQHFENAIILLSYILNVAAFRLTCQLYGFSIYMNITSFQNV